MRGLTAGLIVANEEADGRAMLRAELPVAGQTLLEHQLRLLAEAGVAPLVVLAEQLTPALIAAIDRVRRDGIAVERAASAPDAAERLDGAARVLIVGDGLVTEPATLDLLLAAPGRAVLTVPNDPAFEAHELIGPTARWAGLLLTDGLLLRQTAHMLGDWDLCSTLLRQAIQAGAVEVPTREIDPPPLLVAVADPAGALAAEQGIAARAVRRPTSLIDRYVSAPLARLAAPPAMAAMLDPQWFRGGAVAVTLLGAIGFLFGWPGVGLGALLFAGPLDTLGRYLAGLARRNRRDHRRWSLARIAASVAALTALAWAVSRATGDGAPLALAAATVTFVAAATTHQRWIARPPRPPLWLAEPDNLIWLLLPFAVGGWWTAGLAAQAALAAASLFALQRLTGGGRTG